MIEPWLYPVLTAVALVTGFIDAIAGGGGLIMMPALLVSGVPPLLALGTNKLQSMCGTFVAMRNYGAKGLIEWRPNLPTALIVFAGSASGALLVQFVEARTLALVIPLLLLANAIYILVSPRMSDEDAHQRVNAKGYAPVGRRDRPVRRLLRSRHGKLLHLHAGGAARLRPDASNGADEIFQLDQQCRGGAAVCAWRQDTLATRAQHGAGSDGRRVARAVTRPCDTARGSSGRCWSPPASQ
jgi:hypothetical protein